MRAKAILLVLLLPLAAEGQDVVVTARAGLMQVMNESYDLVYGRTTPTVGVAGRIDLGRRWSLSLGADMGRKEGRQIIYTPEGPVPGDTLVDIALQTVNLAVGVRAGPVVLSIGPALLRLEEKSEFDRNTVSAYGGHAAARIERSFRSWTGGLELGYLHVPRVFEAGGAAAVEDETSFSAVTLIASFGHRF